MEKTFYCEPCKKTLQLYNKNRHELSKGHILKVEKSSNSKSSVLKKSNSNTFECVICAENTLSLEESIECSSCKQLWCVQCDKNLGKCPFCRKDIVGKEELLRRQRQEREEEYEHDLRNMFSGNLEESIGELQFFIRLIQILNNF